MISKKGQFKKGQIAWNKGTRGIMKTNQTTFKKGEHCSLNTEIKKGQRLSTKTEFKKGFTPWNKNKKTGYNKKQADKMRGRKSYNKGKPLLNARGEKHWNWKGGISPINQSIRHSLEMKLWQDSVKNRDGNHCQRCGEDRVSKIMAHHILNFSKYIELRFAIDNGITFCRDCHKEFHKKYGIKNNSREQLIEFLNK